MTDHTTITISGLPFRMEEGRQIGWEWLRAPEDTPPRLWEYVTICASECIMVLCRVELLTAYDVNAVGASMPVTSSIRKVPVKIADLEVAQFPQEAP